jgi:PAP2 superfamily
MATVRWLQHFFGAGPHGLFLAFTFLGASAVLWPLLVLCHWLVDPRFARRLGVLLASAMVASQMLKLVFGTSRPYDLDAALSTESARRTGGGHGFPSGHTTNAATFWLGFAFRYARTWFWTAAILIVFAVALSRVYLGVHMPIDVVGGFVLGAVFAWIAGGSWTGAPPKAHWLWGPVVGIGSLGLALLGVAQPAACALLAGCFLADPAFVPPRTMGGRIAIVIGGVAVLGLLGLLLGWLPERLSPGLMRTPAGEYCLFLILALVAFELWPRVYSSMTS